MTEQEMLYIFHKEMRRDAQIPGYIREENKHVVRHIAQFEDKGFILWSNLDNENAREIIDQELSYFSTLKQDFEWKVYSYDKPDNLMEILKEKGFTIGDQEGLMVMHLVEDHPLLVSEPHQSVVEITDARGIQDIIALEDEIWNESHAELGERLLRDKQNIPESLFLYGVYENHQLVSAAWMYLEQNTSFASMWGGSTLKPYRGKGLYTALLAARAKKAYEMGYVFLTVDASPMSKPILEKVGFNCLAYSYGCDSPSFKKD